MSSLYDLINEIESNNKTIEGIIKSEVDKYTRRLDSQIKEILAVISGLEVGEEYTDEQLEIDLMKLSTLIYNSVDSLAILGSRSDMSKNIRNEKYNDSYKSNDGTVAERKAYAENDTLQEQIIEDIYKRAYDQVKLKIEKADSVHSSLKKIFSKREKEMEIWRKDYHRSKHSGDDE